MLFLNWSVLCVSGKTDLVVKTLSTCSSSLMLLWLQWKQRRVSEINGENNHVLSMFFPDGFNKSNKCNLKPLLFFMYSLQYLEFYESTVTQVVKIQNFVTWLAKRTVGCQLPSIKDLQDVRRVEKKLLMMMAVEPVQSKGGGHQTSV